MPVDAIRFRNGTDIVCAIFKRFNVNVQNRTAKLHIAFDEADHIKLSGLLRVDTVSSRFPIAAVGAMQ